MGGQALLPFEGPETHCREWLNLFAPEGCTRVVDFNVGSGNMALAAARRHMRYQGYAFSDLHKSVCKQILILKVVRELILQKKDGFFSSRFLSKIPEALGGSEAPSEVPSDATTLVLPGGIFGSPSKASEGAIDKKDDENDNKTHIDKDKKEKEYPRRRRRAAPGHPPAPSDGSVRCASQCQPAGSISYASNIIASRIAHLGQCLGHLEGLRWLSRRVLSVGACESYKLSLLRAIRPGSVVSDSPNEGCGFWQRTEMVLYAETVVQSGAAVQLADVKQAEVFDLTTKSCSFFCVQLASFELPVVAPVLVAWLLLKRL